jgi:hypothetical protein
VHNDCLSQTIGARVPRFRTPALWPRIACSRCASLDGPIRVKFAGGKASWKSIGREVTERGEQFEIRDRNSLLAVTAAAVLDAIITTEKK